MNKSWLEQQVQNEKLKKVQEEKKDGTIQKGLYRVRIKDKYRWDLWENDFRVVIAYSKDDAELKFTEMTGFNEHYYIESIEKIVLSDIEKILLEN
ncbi:MULTISPECIES: hypothetical protein [Gammaproteobacteria]|uniref:Uncharacterized protein n=33 Tax=Enterobacterales TaxID=91347 RepID=A0A0C5EQ32_ECOLX|nr:MULTISPECIES: hypothetical protein [Gammaproteobacteria]AKS03364.1 hypothetical protein H222_28475 [Klebsiella pneumoniae UHKPC33]EAA0475618.1 hypothetical protein [Salmonella enterica subsp. enterica serovar Litchfield]EAA4174256.1 hypothetical protein [Salmonella enterica subsp. enterica serovar Braenderup]EAB9300342.1 hypothetical protein [Salmonella enterica subsp. enterica serovar Haifa]EAB9804896.1 hypothetical protein [Salmonella enterica subsp. enterica serovar Adelaide]EAN4118272.